VGVVILMGCGGSMVDDAGVDAGGVDAGVVRPDAGPSDSGVVVMPVDAGRTEHTVFGAMTLNGTPFELWSGYGTVSPRTHQFRLITDDLVDPRVQMTLVVPLDAGAGFTAACGGPQPIILSAQYIVGDAGTAFFTLNQACLIRLSKVAAAVGEEYQGTFSGSVDLDPRSALDAGFQTLTITNGTFRMVRQF
jgi:hypothetical protein